MTDDFAEVMSARLRADLKVAMRARMALEVSVLRSLIAAIDNAQAIPVAPGHQPYVARAFGDESAEAPRLRLSEADVFAVLDREAETRADAADELDRCGRPAEAAALREQAGVVNRYLDRFQRD